MPRPPSGKGLPHPRYPVLLEPVARLLQDACQCPVVQDLPGSTFGVLDGKLGRWKGGIYVSPGYDTGCGKDHEGYGTQTTRR